MKKQKVSDKGNSSRRSSCPVACTLDILGDKWTLVIVRDLYFGKKTYSEIQASPEGIPTNILADRLKKLEQAGVVSKSPYQERPVRYAYQLTKMGKDLEKLLYAIKEWGLKYIPDTNTQLLDAYMKKSPENKS